ncbi:hypothetical protein E3N88_11192 [Mikania micrantha]|uniref:Retrotransposon gag domain-containing protein n=1 Tax=Mikania micrantha TaxID=192012 RepID=A0A5N6PCM5_9ASTR|nr:hypothetical protein E3N88_11192 [Mikania micrantha]
MVQTRGSSEGEGTVFDALSAQLAAITAAMESLKADVSALKKDKSVGGSGAGRHDDSESYSNSFRNFRPYNKIDFPKYGGEEDPRGWFLKADKYFRYYSIPDNEKIDIASMHLEGDALDLYSWLSAEQPLHFWEELVLAFQKNFGPAEFQNPDEYLCSIKQTGTVQEYRQEFAKRSARVSNWSDNSLLGVCLNGLKEELKADVRIHKPKTVYNALSLAMEYEAKVGHGRTPRTTTWTLSSKATPEPKTTPNPVNTRPSQYPNTSRLSETEKQARFIRGECYRCGDKYGPGHRCKTSVLKLMESEEPEESNQEVDKDQHLNLEEMAEISLNAIFDVCNSVAINHSATVDSIVSIKLHIIDLTWFS